MALDPISILFIIQSAITFATPVIDNLITEYKDGKNVTINDVRVAIQKQLQQVYDKNEIEGNRLANQLLSLQAIQKSPAIQDAIEQIAAKIEQRQAQLRDELSRAEIESIRANLKASEAEDSSILKKGKKTQDLAKEYGVNYTPNTLDKMMNDAKIVGGRNNNALQKANQRVNKIERPI